MEPLTWTGSLSALNPIFLLAWAVLGIAVVAQIVLGFFSMDAEMQGDALAAKRSPVDYAAISVKASFAVIVLLILIYMIGGILMILAGMTTLRAAASQVAQAALQMKAGKRALDAAGFQPKTSSWVPVPGK